MTVIIDDTFESGTDNLAARFSATVTQDTADAHSGTGSLLVQCDDAFAGVISSNWPYNPVVAGQAYQLTFWHKLDSGTVGTISFILQWSDAGSNNLTSDTVHFTPGASWAQTTLYATAPAGAAYLALEASTNTAVAGSKYRLDDITVQTWDSPYLIDTDNQAAVNALGLTTASFTPADGELLIVKTGSWDNSNDPGAVSDSSGLLDWVPVAWELGGSFNGQVRIWAAQVGTSPGAITVSTAAPSNSCHHILWLSRWGNAELGEEPAVASVFTNSSGTPSADVDTKADNAVICWASYDNNTVDPTGRAYLGGAVESGFSNPGGDGVFYGAYQQAATAGTATFGMSAPTGQRYSMAGVVLYPTGQAPVPPSTPHIASISQQAAGNVDPQKVPIPPNVQAGSIVLVGMYGGDSSTTMTAPADWTDAPDMPSALSGSPSGPNLNEWVFWHRATGREDPGFYSFPWDAGATTTFGAFVIVHIRGAIETGSPWDDTDVATTTTAASSTTPAVTVTTTGPDRLVVHIGTEWNGGAWTPPTGFTQGTVDPTYGLISLSDHLQAAAGSSGALTATCSGTASSAMGWAGALIPAGAGGPTSATGSDTAGGTDTATRAAQSFTRTASDTGAGSDTATRAAQSFARTASDVAAGSDVATQFVSLTRIATDTAAATDAATRAAQVFVRSSADSAAATDAAAPSMLVARSASDLAAAADVASTVLLLARGAADVAAAVDAATRGGLVMGRHASDHGGGTDAARNASASTTRRPLRVGQPVITGVYRAGQPVASGLLRAGTPTRLEQR